MAYITHIKPELLPIHIKLLQKFIAECCVFEDGGLIHRKDFYNNYIDWLSQQPDVVETPSQVSISGIISRYFISIRGKGGNERNWVGITTKQKYVTKRIPVEIEKDVDNLLARFAQKPAPVQSSQSKEQGLLGMLEQPYGESKHCEPVGASTTVKTDLDCLNTLLATNQVVFITGRAGTGKTTLLREWIASRGDEGMLLTATTGTAADNASCNEIKFKTVHSAFWIHGTKPIIDRDETANKFLTEDSQKIKNLLVLLKKYHTLVIEEVSMARSDLIGAIDQTLKWAMKNDKPFGGLRVVLCGDLAQLPPVVKNDEIADVLRALNHRYGGIYFFNNKSIQKLKEMKKFATLELKIVRRQSDPLFIKILDHARTGKITREDLEIINSSKNKNQHAIILAAIRKLVDGINEDKLNSLKAPIEQFNGMIDRYADPQNLCFKYPSPPNPLTLKAGARVMIVSNGEGYHNGSLGEYTGKFFIGKNFEDCWMEIKLDGGNTVAIRINKQSEYKMDFDKKEDKVTQILIAEYLQFPVILAYALTVHRSQGQSFDSVEFRRGRAWNFGHGLIYTMLSRCRSLEGLNIVDPLNANDFTYDANITQFQS